jgi:hypothetical protein
VDRLRKEQQFIIEDLRPRFAELSVYFFSRGFITVGVERVFKYHDMVPGNENGASISVDSKNMTRENFLKTAKDYLDFIGFDESFKMKFLEWCRKEIPKVKASEEYPTRTKRDDAKADLRELAEYFFRELSGRHLKAVLAPSKKRITRITPHTAARVTTMLFNETYDSRMSMTEANLKKIFTEYEKELSAKKKKYRTRIFQRRGGCG